MFQYDLDNFSKQLFSCEWKRHNNNMFEKDKAHGEVTQY